MRPTRSFAAPRLSLAVLAVVVLAGCLVPSHRPLTVPATPATLTGIGRPFSRSNAEAPAWEAVAAEAADWLKAYLRINTTNPPGNELEAARFLADLIAREGIAVQVFEPAPGKANLYARLRGDGTKRPLILLSHMDVVLASAEHWSVPPFEGVERDGRLYGRGALDMKGQAIVELMTFIQLKRMGTPLSRDVIFLATADEETVSGVGAGWFVANHRELVAGAEFVLNEGGTIEQDGRGDVVMYGIGVTEKSPFWLDVTALGTPGHGSRPTPDNPVDRLIRALDRVSRHTTPLRAIPAAKRYFADLATRETDSRLRRWYADIDAALADSAGARAVTSDLYHNAILRNTISITGLRASEKTNVIPPSASATLDIRLLPGERPEDFLATLRSVIGDTLVRLTPQGATWDATESSLDTDLFRAIQDAALRRHPNALITTPVLAGFTDSHHFRRLGIASYGVSPFPLGAGERGGIHGNDESVTRRQMRFGVEFFWDVVMAVVR